MRKSLLIVCFVFIGLLLVSGISNAQDKIVGPWLWMIAPCEAGKGGAQSTDIDQLDAASKGKVTEDLVAKNGAKENDKVGDLAWTKGTIEPEGGDNVNGAVTKIKLGQGDINDHSSYAFIAIKSAKEQKSVTMRVGSDDSIKVWLNGEVVHKNAIDRGANDFQDKFNVDLKAGDNLLLVKVSERGGGWSMFAGINAEFEAGGKKYVPGIEPKDPGDKITGPWLWMIAPGSPCGGVGTDIDWIEKEMGAKLTEQIVAQKGIKEGDKFGKLVWTKGKISPTGGDNINGTITEIGLGAGDINNTVSYAYINVVSPSERKTFIHTGSDDSLKVWVNGEVVVRKAVDRGASDFQEWTLVTLKKGNNPMLVRVGECGGGWSMFVGFSKDDKDLEYNLSLPNIAVEPAGKLSSTWGEIKGK